MEDRKLNVRTIYDSLYKHRKLVGGLLISLLILLNIFVFMKVLPIFDPVRQFLAIVTTPILVAVIFFYIFKPLYQKLQSFKLSNTLSAAIVFLVIITVFAVTFGILVPAMNREVGRLVTDFPGYWATFMESLENLFHNLNIGNLQEQVDLIVQRVTEAISGNIGNIISESFTGVRSLLTSLFSFGIILFTFPIILFYLFRDGDRLPAAILKLLPTKTRPLATQIFTDIDEQLSLYIRGQILVCFWVGVMFFIGYTIIGLPYALLLAFFAGVLNIIPYLGSFIAIVPSMIIAIASSPLLFVQVLIVFAIEQTIESRVISPKVLGDNLKIHPITILIVLLSAGRLFGIGGIIVGVPTYAIIKSILRHAFKYLQDRTQLFEPEENQ